MQRGVWKFLAVARKGISPPAGPVRTARRAANCGAPRGAPDYLAAGGGCIRRFGGTSKLSGVAAKSFKFAADSK